MPTLYLGIKVHSHLFILWSKFPGGLVVKNPPVNAGRCRECKFDPWVGKIPWKRKWQPILVLLPGEFLGQRSLAGYSPWGCKELDMTEQLTLNNMVII